MFGIPAVKGIVFGSGFASARLRGSENNDPFVLDDNGKIVTETNHCGGILGGISTGMCIDFRVAIKPTPSIALPQRSVDLKKMQPVTLAGFRAGHDPCIVPRRCPVWRQRRRLPYMTLCSLTERRRNMNLIDLRREMDETDRALLALFARRMALSGAIARVKQGAHLPILDPRREEEKLHQAADSVPSELAEYARDLYRLLMAQSRTYQEKLLSGEVE